MTMLGKNIKRAVFIEKLFSPSLFSLLFGKFMENPGEKHSEARKHAITSYENKETARESCGKRKPKDVESETGNIYRNGK